MSKIQKTALVCSIAFCLHYALYKLLNFTFFMSFFANHLWLDKLLAFLIGAAAFLDILIFKKDE
ncbi:MULTISPECIES: hypothetical protein [Bacillota]|uniref:Uncharacterized protein n=2 Tax=Amedibacillus TaxID=2749846 RepID=A0A7G9GIY7_9FIRM|nr:MULTISPECIES: hypothetical protein [Bacillota]QNM10769.1 hypothetical protein H9Q80_10750 [[Eubacterium] hominis]MCH4285736.1 hypothetical protein [Amedibacillus hominis]RGB53925.1 hypothetical protein DW271_10790 [Absiella sp. AM22-9]RGB61315.1 hypothetical protein DW120_07720 [Absiella sp. AM10-20]RGB64211.1 hypothetical protein DW113_16095 [Absiella sp. AM09-45]